MVYWKMSLLTEYMMGVTPSVQYMLHAAHTHYYVLGLTLEVMFIPASPPAHHCYHDNHHHRHYHQYQHSTHHHCYRNGHQL